MRLTYVINTVPLRERKYSISLITCEVIDFRFLYRSHLTRVLSPFTSSDGNVSSFRNVVFTSSPYKDLLEDLKKKKKDTANKKRFQSRSQDINVRNVPGKERILMCIQKSKSYMVDRSEASKIQTFEVTTVEKTGCI